MRDKEIASWDRSNNGRTQDGKNCASCQNSFPPCGSNILKTILLNVHSTVFLDPDTKIIYQVQISCVYLVKQDP